MPRITKRTVDAALPKPTRYIVWDEAIAGFGLIVLPSGVKSYIYNYRTAEGRNRRTTIGRHGKLTAEQARNLAREHQHAVVHGADPLGEKQALRAAATIGDILDAYLTSDAFANKTPGTQASDRARIERHLRPLLGKRHAHLTTHKDIRRAFNAIRDGATATHRQGQSHVRGGIGAARMAIIVLGVIFNWAKREGMVQENPCKGVAVGAHGRRETILEDASDYQRLFATLDRMEQECLIRPPIADAIRLIALTGCRRGEAANLKWKHVDLKRGRIVLPPLEHKAGHRTGEPRIIALPTAAQALISRQPDGGADDYVFPPTRGKGGAADLSHLWAKVRTQAGLPADLGLHGLRHSIASHLAMAGVEGLALMQTLGHKQIATTARYVHYRDGARSALAERAASVPLAGMAAASKPKGKVLRIKSGGRP